MVCMHEADATGCDIHPAVLSLSWHVLKQSGLHYRVRLRAENGVSCFCAQTAVQHAS